MPPSFPYPYTVRLSARAKRINARIRPGLGLELILPKALAGTPLGPVLQRFQPWAEKHYPRIMGQPCPQAEDDFPRGVFLQGGMEYISFFSALPDLPALEKQASLLLPPHALALQGRPGDASPQNWAGLATVALRRIPFSLAVAPKEPAAFLAVAKNWLRLEARRVLEPELLALAQEIRVSPKEIRFRHTRTRWGSCSAKGNINLALSLIFLPPDLARYVLVHELCHLKELNHSQAFWKEVLALEPLAMGMDKRLRAGWRYVPNWL